MNRSVAFALSLLIVTGCTSKKTHHGVLVWANNAATLDGPPVGAGTEPSSRLSAIVGAALSGPGLSVPQGQAYLARSSSSTEAYRIIVPVTNNTSLRQCFLKADIFDVLDGNGSIVDSLAGDTGSYIAGSVGVGTTGVYTNTCLESGASGYLLEVSQQPIFSYIMSVSISMSSSSGVYSLPAAEILPESYVSGPGTSSVLVANEGTGPGSIATGFSQAVFFDASGQVQLFWDFLDPAIGAPTYLSPGATSELVSTSSLALWNGYSTEQDVLVDFDDGISGGALTLDPSGPDAAAAANARKALQAKRQKALGAK